MFDIMQLQMSIHLQLCQTSKMQLFKCQWHQDLLVVAVVAIHVKNTKKLEIG